MDLITTLTSQVMNKALDGLSKRHQAIASNLANVDTPHYKRRDVSFEGALGKALEDAKQSGRPAQRRPASNDEPLAMQATRPGHIPLDNGAASVSGVPVQVTETEDLAYRSDGNSVDVETEMVRLAENTQRYMAVSSLQSRSLRGLRSIITGNS